jgi:hypothetical protein
MAYDIIGDIHGHASELKALLVKLGYSQKQGVWRHPGRTAVFVGDLIDRGPEQVETVRLVRAMVDAGAANCVMGNHELNAIGFVTEDPERPGEFLRPHTSNKIFQHAEFLKEVGQNSPLHLEIVKWLRTLPAFLNLRGIRVVHAWWHEPHIALLSQSLSSGKWHDDLVLQAHRESSPLYKAAQEAMKGLEVALPDGALMLDGDGHERHEVRVRWWDENIRTYRDGWIGPPQEGLVIPDLPLPPGLPLGVSGDSPVFFGHYWLEGVPAPFSPKAACLDYSVAKGGPLVAYRWNGEPDLMTNGFVCSR